MSETSFRPDNEPAGFQKFLIILRMDRIYTVISNGINKKLWRNIMLPHSFYHYNVFL